MYCDINHVESRCVRIVAIIYIGLGSVYTISDELTWNSIGSSILGIQEFGKCHSEKPSTSPTIIINPKNFNSHVTTRVSELIPGKQKRGNGSLGSRDQSTIGRLGIKYQFCIEVFLLRNQSAF